MSDTAGTMVTITISEQTARAALHAIVAKCEQWPGSEWQGTLDEFRAALDTPAADVLTAEQRAAIEAVLGYLQAERRARTATNIGDALRFEEEVIERRRMGLADSTIAILARLAAGGDGR